MLHQQHGLLESAPCELLHCCILGREEARPGANNALTPLFYFHGSYGATASWGCWDEDSWGEDGSMARYISWMRAMQSGVR